MSNINPKLEKELPQPTKEMWGPLLASQILLGIGALIFWLLGFFSGLPEAKPIEKQRVGIAFTNFPIENGQFYTAILTNRASEKPGMP